MATIREVSRNLTPKQRAELGQLISKMVRGTITDAERLRAKELTKKNLT